MTAMSINWRRALILLLAIIACGASPSWADSWVLPEMRTYSSADGRFRLTVTPRSLDSQLGYFADKVDGREPAGQRTGSAQTFAQGLLERREPDGRWTKVWEGPLRNEVAPVDVLVSPGGTYVVTFDNWHAVGHGGDVIVIYDARGEVVRSLGLSDFLSREHIAALPRTVSSIRWRQGYRISADGRRLQLEIAPPGVSDSDSAPPPIDLGIELATGQPIAEPAADSRTMPNLALIGGVAAAVGLLAAAALFLRRRTRGA